MAIPVGSKAPDFTLKSKTASGFVDVKLSDNFGQEKHRAAVFPGGVHQRLHQGNVRPHRRLGAYAGLDAEVIGISVDTPFAQEAWAQKRKNRHHARQRFEQGSHKTYDVLFPDARRGGRHGGARGVRD